MDNKEKDINYFAAVIGDWHFNTLGMVRSLGEKDVPVIYINMSESGYAEDSKYTRKTYHAHSKEEVINAILNAAEEFKGVPVLFPGCDTAALYIDEAYDLLKDKCICPGFKGNMAHYMDKFNMCNYAKEAGFNAPDGFVMSVDENGFSKLREYPFPYIIKPLKSVDGLKADIRICRNTDDFEEAVKWLKTDGSGYDEVLVEEFVDGKENAMTGYCGCSDGNGSIYIFGELKKYREYPIGRGSTSYAMIKKDLSYVDEATLKRFLEITKYDGIFDFDIKIVDGVPYFLETNFRNGALSYAYTVAGFNIAYVWYCMKTGRKIESIDFNEVVFMCERDDLNHVKDKNISVAEWIKCIRKTDVMMLYNKNDKEPFRKAYGKPVTAVLSLLARNLK